MGGPRAGGVPQELLPRIEEILRNCSSRVEILELTEQDRAVGFYSLYECVDEFDSKMIVSIQRHARTPPDGIALILHILEWGQTRPKSRKSFDAEIEAILLAEGMIHPKQFKDYPTGKR